MAYGQVKLVQQDAAVAMASGDAPSLIRPARFLLPQAHRAHLPSLPTPRIGALGPVTAEAMQIQAEFKAWAGSPRLWRRWVEKLLPRHEQLWREVGILHAILASTYPAPRHHERELLQLVAFWCRQTNTFVFPWGEATLTLEDVAVLAGLPLVGVSVRADRDELQLQGDMAAIDAIRREMHRSGSRKPKYGRWVSHFLDPEQQEEEEEAGAGGADEDEHVEHGAFLAMWLSRFVFPAPQFDVVQGEVLPTAVRLARGHSVALAPAVLAHIYDDLSSLKRHVVMGKGTEVINVSAPMEILQLWVWERFPELRPEMASSSPNGVISATAVPRVARWQGASKTLNPNYVRAVLMSPKDFLWRPYSLLQETHGGSWVHGQDAETARSNAMLSFARCLHPCDLVGMDSIKQYCPQRVALQLGFDQDVPEMAVRLNTECWVKVWETYDIENERFVFADPSDNVAVTAQYEQWWQPIALACATAVADASKMKVLPRFVNTTKRKLDGLPSTSSGKNKIIQTDTRTLQPTTAAPLDLDLNIPLVEPINRGTECLVKGAEQEQVPEGEGGDASAGANKKVLHNDIQALSDEMATSLVK
ncbi:hypothetical protein ACP4OV_012415 [Aristida adscensionis]